MIPERTKCIPAGLAVKKGTSWIEIVSSIILRLTQTGHDQKFLYRYLFHGDSSLNSNFIHIQCFPSSLEKTHQKHVFSCTVHCQLYETQQISEQLQNTCVLYVSGVWTVTFRSLSIQYCPTYFSALPRSCPSPNRIPPSNH